MTETWLLILLVVVVLAVAIWWLLRKPAPTETAAPTLDRREGSRPIDADAVVPVVPVVGAPDIAPEPPIPVVIGSAGSPLDVAPPPLPVADDARVVEPEPVAESFPAGEGLIDAEPLHAPTAHSQGADDLTILKGVGPKLAARLGELGVTRLSQIAGWAEADVARIDAQLGNFRGRPMRDRWVEQAGLLAAGDRKGYEERFGRIEG